MKEIIQKLIKFREDRDWKKFHTGQALSHKLMVEAAEIGVLFEWGKIPDKNKLRFEIADVFIFLCYLAHDNNIDLLQSVLDKIELNKIMHPTYLDYEKARGWGLAK